MTAPTYDWPASVTSGNYGVNNPLNQARVRAIRQGLEHVRSTLYDPATHIPAAQHDHDGINSALLQTPGGNLVEQSSLNSSSATLWTRSGATLGSAAVGGMIFSSLGHYGYISLGGPSDGSYFHAEDAAGAGMEFNASIFMKASGALTTGALQFGLTDASTSTFATGASASVGYSRLSTSYARFYFRGTTASTFASGVWFLLRVTEAFSASVRVDCVQVTLGPLLCYWHPAQTDPMHYKYRYISQDCPCWDTGVSIASAAELTAS